MCLATLLVSVVSSSDDSVSDVINLPIFFRVALLTLGHLPQFDSKEYMNIRMIIGTM